MSRITRWSWTRPSGALLVVAALALLAPDGAAAAPTLQPIGSFNAPVSLTAPPRDPSRIFVVERAGTIEVIHNGTRAPTPFLDITSDVDTTGERGLLSMAFAPDYAASGLFYVYMVAKTPLGQIQIREYHRSTASAEQASPTGRIVFTAEHDQAPNHNGGQIQWGPDGHLWFATGDGGGANDQFGHARDPASPLGKLLRIDPRPGNAGTYTIPADNPVLPGQSAPSAVWAYGLRNPFRFSFDRGSGDLVIGDVGQSKREEIDWAPASSRWGRGGDFGWGCLEGTAPGPEACSVGANYIPPIFDYSRDPNRAITGGHVVRDPGLPTLVGRYLYVDFYGGDIRSIRLAPGATDDRSTGLSRTSVASFGEDAGGRVYVVSLNGEVDRIQDDARPPVPPQGGGAPGGGPAPPPPPGTDQTAPRVRIRVARRGRVGRRVTPRIQLVASEDCHVTVSARLAGTRLRGVRRPLRGAQKTIVRLRPRGAEAVKRIRRALRRHGRVTLKVSVTARDPSGNVGRVKKRLTVRRA